MERGVERSGVGSVWRGLCGEGCVERGVEWGVWREKWSEKWSEKCVERCVWREDFVERGVE